MKLLLSLFFSLYIHSGDTMKATGDSSKPVKKVAPVKKGAKPSFRLAPSILLFDF